MRHYLLVGVLVRRQLVLHPATADLLGGGPRHLRVVAHRAPLVGLRVGTDVLWVPVLHLIVPGLDLGGVVAVGDVCRAGSPGGILPDVAVGWGVLNVREMVKDVIGRD